MYCYKIMTFWIESPLWEGLFGLRQIHGSDRILRIYFAPTPPFKNECCVSLMKIKIMAYHKVKKH